MKHQGFRSHTIIDYLTHREWGIVKESPKFVRLEPPVSIGLPDNYSLVVPVQETAVDFEKNFLRIVKIISDIYDISDVKLKNLFTNDGAILSFRFDDEKTADGTVLFHHFEGFLEKFKKTILDIASSTAFRTPFVEEYAMEAYTYLNSCKYLQTEHGSFVTNIQLPSELVLRQPTLFDPEPFFAKEVNRRIFDYIDFTVNTILENNQSIYNENYILEHQDFLSVQILEDISGVIKKANSRNIHFSFVDKMFSEEIRAKNITEKKIGYLSDYINFLKHEIEENISMDVVGKIVELRSRNPDSNRNYILVNTEFENQVIFLAVHLDNMDYQRAIQAHRNNRAVNIKGKAKRMRTQYKITKLDYIHEA